MLIVVLEDDSTLRNSLIGGLELDGHEALGTDSVRQARDYTLKRPVDAIICDVHLVGESGLDLVRELRADGFGGVILVVTAFGTIDLAVEAMRNARPVLVSNRGALPELVIDGYNGLVFDMDDPNGLAQALDRVATLDLARMGDNARAVFNTIGDLSGHLEKVDRVYATALARKG